MSHDLKFSTCNGVRSEGVKIPPNTDLPSTAPILGWLGAKIPSVSNYFICKERFTTLGLSKCMVGRMINNMISSWFSSSYFTLFVYKTFEIRSLADENM